MLNYSNIQIQSWLNKFLSKLLLIILIKFSELATSSFNKQQESLVTNVIVTNTVTTTATFTKKTAEERNRSIESTFLFCFIC